ncbi:putative copper P-type ATPase [Escherichia coli M056]|uniref:DNA-binding protein n=1 Tax=Escherichia coli TaxID=562 RepID=UPI000A185C14|nr:DNA-binding protein [Escherichia coli]OSK22858.1 putative copper P-type ATPase [Escherichia coli M056]
MKLKPMGTPGKAPAHAKPWTQQEDELLISLYPDHTTRQMMEHLQRTLPAIKHRLALLRQRTMVGIKKKPLSREALAILIRDRHIKTAQELADEVGCSPHTVKHILNKRGYRLQKCGENHPSARYSDHLVELITELRDGHDMRFSAITKHINSTMQMHLNVDMVIHLYSRRTAADAVLYELLPD